MQNRKKKRKAVTVHERHFGKEPEPGTVIEGTIDLAHVYNTYSYIFSRKDAREFLNTYLKKENPKLFEKIKTVSDDNISTTLCWIARLRTIECTLPDNSYKFFDKKIEELEKIADNYKEKQESPRIAPSDTKTENLIASLEDEIDKLVLNKFESDFDPLGFYNQNEASQNSLIKIISYYSPLLEELNEIPKDDQLKEAYSCYTKKQIRVFEDFIQKIIDDANGIINNKKRVRKPRKKKSKPAEKIVKNLKYLKYSKDLNISSISPEKILGKNEIYLYNEKDRKLVYLVTDGSFDVRGTTITGFNDEKSYSCTIRKPKDIIPELSSATKKQSKMISNGIKTRKAPSPSGRMNENFLILNVF